MTHVPSFSHGCQLSTVSTPDDSEAVARLVKLAFGGEIEGCRDWIKHAGVEHLRVMRAQSPEPCTLPSCMLRIPMGVFLGGNSIKLLGIAGVAVAPECRGQGLALRMMRAAMIEAASEGWPLAGLYASTQALYRQVGFEQSGDRCAISLRVPSIGLRERGTPITPITDADMPAVHQCYLDHARRFDGALDRGPYIWNRIRKLRDKTYEGFATRGRDGGIDGYLFMHQSRKDSGKFDLVLSDFVGLNADAYRRLLGFLSDFGMMAELATFHAGPHHPALMLLPQQSFEIKHHEFWMLRVLDAKKALEARGWPTTMRGSIELDIQDELIEANNGRWVLEVSEGRATLTRGGAGKVRVPIRGLAPLFTGLQNATSLATAGLLDATPADLRAADSIFVRGAPWTGDFY